MNAGSLAHWYLDHLARLAPRQVVLTEPTEAAMIAAVRGLPYGRALPDAKEVVASARDYVPLPALDEQAEITLPD